MRLIVGIALSLVGLSGHSQERKPTPYAAPAPKAPARFLSDDQLAQEERDARYLMDLQVHQAQAQADSSGRVRKEQEQAASAMRKLYEELLEQKRQELTPEDASVLGAIRSQQAPSLGAVAQRLPQNPGSEASRALDALALEDGPDVAREKGLGFVAQGTVAEIRLLTAVNTSIPGVVIGQLIYDIWDVDVRMIVIPRGSKLIGACAQMGSDTEARGKITFSQFMTPGGRVIPIAVPVMAANRVGITGVDGKVDYHWGRMLGGTMALAVVNAFTGGGANNVSPYGQQQSMGDMTRMNAMSTIGQASQQLLQRFTKIQPDITIEEGTVAKVILVTSLMAKPHRTVWVSEK